MAAQTQSFENHGKMVPLYHGAASMLVFFPTLYFVVLAVTDFSTERLAFAAFCVGTMLYGFFARAFPLGVQDRVIRLEERLRLERLLPDDLEPRIGELTTEHLIGLRFAADDELAELTRRVLAGELTDRKAIKRAVRSWRPDHQRI